MIARDEASASSAPSVMGSKKANERLVGPMDRAEQARRRGDHEGERDVGGVQLESTRPKPEEGIARVRDKIDVVDQDDRGPMVPLTRHEASQRPSQVGLDSLARSTQTGVGDADVEPDLEVEPLAPVGINPGLDRLSQPAEELVLRLRIGHGQDDRIAGLLAQPAPVHEEGRLPDRPVAEEGGVLRLALAGPRDARREDGRLALTPGQHGRKDPAARPEWVVGSCL